MESDREETRSDDEIVYIRIQALVKINAAQRANDLFCSRL